jgi:hypothetical protein
MNDPSLSIGQAVCLRSGLAWDEVIKPNAVGVVVGICGSDCYRVGFPVGVGRPPLIGEFFLSELLIVR